MNTRPVPLARRATAAVIVVAALGFAACGGSSSKGGSPGAATDGTAAVTASGDKRVLPVSANPIKNASTVEALKIDSVLVENNVDPKTGKAVDDHLEIALRNTGTTELSGFEIYYTIDDPTAKASESYYTKLPDGFTIAAGANRIAHFDNTGAPDHFPANKFSLYATSKNPMDVSVEVSATDAAVQRATVKKDAGGAENPGE